MKYSKYNHNKHKAGRVYLNPRSLITKSLVRKMEQICDKSLKWTQLKDDLGKDREFFHLYCHYYYDKHL